MGILALGVRAEWVGFRGWNLEGTQKTPVESSNKATRYAMADA